MQKHKKILIFSKDTGIGRLIAISINTVSKRTGVYIENHIVKCSDDIESDEKFNIIIVNEFPALKELIENKNILLANFGKIVFLTSYQIDIEAVKNFSNVVKSFKKDFGSDFVEQIERIVLVELGLVRPMARVMAD